MSISQVYFFIFFPPMEKTAGLSLFMPAGGECSETVHYLNYLDTGWLRLHGLILRMKKEGKKKARTKSDSVNYSVWFKTGIASFFFFFFICGERFSDFACCVRTWLTALSITALQALSSTYQHWLLNVITKALQGNWIPLSPSVWVCNDTNNTTDDYTFVPVNI